MSTIVLGRLGAAMVGVGTVMLFIYLPAGIVLSAFGAIITLNGGWE